MKFKFFTSWQTASTNQRIFIATVVVMLVSLGARLTTAARELIVAGYFGTSEEVDAFLIALLLPMFAVNVFAGSFSTSVMPTYIETRDNSGPAEAQKLFSSVMALGILFLIVTTFILMWLGPILLPLLGTGFTPETIALAQSLFYWLLPILILSGTGHLYATAINAGEKFAGVALVPAITPICASATLVIMMDRWNIHALAIGTVIGTTIELAVLAWMAKQQNILSLPKWSGMTSKLQSIMRQYGTMVAGAFLMSSTVLIDQAMAAMLDPGSLATLNYANKVVAMILGIGAMALGTVVLPHFSRMVAERDWTGIQHTFKTFTKLIIIVCTPITILLFIFSEDITHILFERGAFNAGDTSLVGEVQAFYVIQIPFYVLSILTVRLISSLKANHILMWGAFISLPLNILLNYYFMQWMGISGIALSTTCVYAISFLYLTFMLIRFLSAGTHHGR